MTRAELIIEAVIYFGGVLTIIGIWAILPDCPLPYGA